MQRLLAFCLAWILENSGSVPVLFCFQIIIFWLLSLLYLLFSDSHNCNKRLRIAFELKFHGNSVFMIAAAVVFKLLKYSLYASGYVYMIV